MAYNAQNEVLYGVRLFKNIYPYKYYIKICEVSTQLRLCRRIV